MILINLLRLSWPVVRCTFCMWCLIDNVNDVVNVIVDDHHDGNSIAKTAKITQQNFSTI